MVQLNTTLSPSTVQAFLGRLSQLGDVADQDALIVERIAANGDILGLVQNDGDTNIVIEVQQGDLNTDADYAVVNVDVNGASVASVTIAPSAAVPFTIIGPGVGAQGPGASGQLDGPGGTANNPMLEGAGTPPLILGRYLRFVVSDQRQMRGMLSLTYYGGTLERRAIFG